jgi:spermidine synthase
MKPFINLAQALTPDGAELSLHGHDSHFYLRVNRQPLMGTNASESEKVMADLACERLQGLAGGEVLIGGLGFGFTLRRVLERVGPSAVVTVAELLPEVVSWNREFLAEVNGLLLDDARVKVVIEDVYQTLTQAPKGQFDAILLDVDNGPVAMVKDGNARLYEAQGLAAIKRVLKPDGRVVFWSASTDHAFAKRLGKAGYAVRVVAAKAYVQAKRATHTLFVGDPQ